MIGISCILSSIPQLLQFVLMKKLWAIYKATITESVNRRGEMLVYILQDFIGPLLSILLWIGIINYSVFQIVSALVFSILAYLIIFFFKFIIGMSAFWVTANDGIVHTSWAF